MNSITFSTLRNRITGVFPAQIRAAVEPLTDEQLWWRPNEASNSIANILLHLTGSLNHFLNRNLGGIDFARDRPAEFTDRSGASKAEVMARFDDMMAKATETFARMSPERLGDPSPEPAMHEIVVQDLINIAAHIAFHAGQIVWIAKMFDGANVHEVWIQTHKSEGAWKARA